MALVAEFEIECQQLPLVSVASAVPDATMRLELQFAHTPGPMFILTTSGASASKIERGLAAAADVGDWSLIGQAGDTRRYQAQPALTLEEQLGDQIEDLGELKALATTDASIERIDLLEWGWRQTGWFADHSVFDQFRQFWDGNVAFRLLRLTHIDEPEPPGDGLTDSQREALRAAYVLGYFEIPRRASLDDVADELDISASACSERLRRAQTELIEETVATTWPPLPTQ